MRNFDLEEVKEICDNAKLPTGDKFIDGRLEEYGKKYNGDHVYYAALRDIAARFTPDFVLELGSWQGTSAACLCSGSPRSIVFTVDHHTDPGDEENRRRVLEACGKYPGMGYIQGWTNTDTWQEQKRGRCAYTDVINYRRNRKIDILFVDSWHRADMAMRDWRDYSPMLADNALVICDDIVGGNSATISGMEEFFGSLPGEKFKDGRIHAGYSVGFVKFQRLVEADVSSE